MEKVEGRGVQMGRAIAQNLTQGEEMRTEYVLTEEEYNEILSAIRPAPVIAIHCGMPASPQEMANAAWDALGDKRGFIGSTVEPVPSKGRLYITAIPKKEKK